MSPVGESTLVFSPIQRPADLPIWRRLLTDTQGLSGKQILADKLIALGDDAREHIVAAQLADDQTIGVFTDLDEPLEHAAVRNLLILIRSRFPQASVLGYHVPTGFIAGIYSHMLDGLSYDDRDDATWREIDLTFIEALKRHATDIYLIGAATTYAIEYLIHGFRVVARHVPAETGERMARALYRSAPHDAQDRNFNNLQPQETSFERTVGSERVRFRYQHIPVNGGYIDVCLRVLRLNDASRRIDFARLGYLPEQVDLIREVTRAPKGLVIATGPTGSGKSTLIKGCLEDYDRYHGSRKNIREISNPVEYVAENVRGTNVVTHGNSTAAQHKESYIAMLRAIVRMNPHAILVGEIRDGQTADLTTEMSRTGHKVFSSAHADSWVELYPRLRNWLANDPGLYTQGFLAAIISQELLPTLCAGCAIPLTERDESHFQIVRDRLRAIDPHAVQRAMTTGHGCDACSHGVPGITGRTVVATIFIPTRPVLELLRQQRDDDAWSAWASGDAPLAGYTTHDHALDHILNGRVDPYEAERVLGALRVRSTPKPRLVAAS